MAKYLGRKKRTLKDVEWLENFKRDFEYNEEQEVEITPEKIKKILRKMQNGRASRRGIFQADSLSPLLFVVCLLPPTHFLRDAAPGYHFASNGSKS